MATQPTNLPVPSESPRDLKFNAGKIDEFVTSLANTYVDRFGNEHYTIEGLRWLAQQAIAQYGWILIDSFQEGADITLPNQALRDEDTGEYYRWDGALPKHVDAGSTPSTTGGIGIGAWVGIGDAALRTMLADSSNPGSGDALVAVKQPYTNAVARTQHDVNADYVSVKDFGALGNGSTNDTNAFKSAIAWLASGGNKRLHIPSGRYIITEQLILSTNNNPRISITGDGSETTILDWDSDDCGLTISSVTSGGWWMDVPGNKGIGFHLDGLSFVTRRENKGVGLSVKTLTVNGRPGPGVTCTDIVWRGYSSMSHYWAVCSRFEDTANPRFLQCRWFMGGPTSPANSSIGVQLIGTNGGDPAEFYFDQCEAFYGGYWITATSYVEGIRLTNCTAINSRALVWNAGAESGLVVIGGHYNNSVTSFNLTGVFDITINGANLYASGPGAQSIVISSGGRFNITGNVLVADSVATTSTGILIANSSGGAAYAALIDSNTFHNYTDSAILLGGGSANVTVGSNNVFANCNADAVDTTGNNRLLEKMYLATQVFTFSNGQASQSFTIPLNATIFRRKPKYVGITTSDFAYNFMYDYDASTATSLIINGRKLDGSVITNGSKVRICYMIPY